MPSLRDQFSHFYALDNDATATAMRTGLVVPDTNVLLNLYRFQREARDELLSLFESIESRLWIPHQVGLEFHRNRLAVIAEQEAYFDKVQKDLEAAIKILEDKVRAFGARIALGKERVQKIDRRVDSMRKHLGDEVSAAEKGNEVHLDGRDSDEVLARLEALLDGKVGGPMEPRELEEAKKEARRRAEAGIPPGYKDKTKPDPTGDYLVWRQLMTEAKDRKLPVVFVTDDRKEDWYRREHGLTLGARYELREEMTAEAGVPLLIMTTETFLRHAKTHLNADVSPATVDQAEKLPTLYRWQSSARDAESVSAASLNRLIQPADPDLARLLGSLDAEQLSTVTRLAIALMQSNPKEAEAA